MASNSRSGRFLMKPVVILPRTKKGTRIMEEKTKERIAMEAEAEMLIARLTDEQIAEVLMGISLHHPAQSIPIP